MFGSSSYMFFYLLTSPIFGYKFVECFGTIALKCLSVSLICLLYIITLRLRYYLSSTGTHVHVYMVYRLRHSQCHKLTDHLLIKLTFRTHFSVTFSCMHMYSFCFIFLANRYELRQEKFLTSESDKRISVFYCIKGLQSIYKQME